MEIILLSVAFGAFILWWMFSSPKRLRKMGDRFPGPKAYPIVGNTFNFPIIGPNAPQSWSASSKKYGYTMRYWLGPELHIFVSEPDDMQMILSSPTLITKSSSYKLLDSWLGTGLLLATGNLWQMRRKAITPTFHFKILEKFIPTFNKCANTLVNCLKDKTDKGYFNIIEFMSNCALDAIAETAMGTEIKAQTEPLEKYPNSISRMTKYLGERLRNPLLGMEPIYTLSGRRQKEAEHLDILFSLPLEVLERKRNEKSNIPSETELLEEDYGAKKKTAFLELLLEMKQKNIPGFQSDKDIKDEVMTFMFEGHDTTTTVLSYTIWLLGMHPDIQEELYNEIKEVTENRELTIEVYQKMHYLERVIKESLRLYPPVPAFGRQATQDIVLPTSGYVIPAGAQIDLVIYLLHRREDIFPEPDKFIPDRFLEPAKHPFAYLPFSAGPRNCIGQKFAMLDLKAIISHVVLNYKIESDSDLEVNPELLLRTSKGPNVKLTVRNP
ncbi:cytochrome P450 4C1 [Halyomorpha halys]|uniref:cytochrome P450 4C1 n=1 Tax=Halyomorpha halys TaxID=286706 RepID=UPI0006D50C0E|nr:cytochrome P450 4C1 [Halyomorpha halys]XP_014284340.1 cytochrome P450 4C1 [Halyomorpha halys]